MHEFIQQLDDLNTRENIRLRDMKEVITYLRTLKFNLDRNELGEYQDVPNMKREKTTYKVLLSSYQKYCYHLWRPELIRNYGLKHFKGFNSGVFLTG